MGGKMVWASCGSGGERVGTGLQFGFLVTVTSEPIFLLIHLKANVYLEVFCYEGHTV